MRPPPYLSSPPIRPIHSSANEADPLRPHLQVVVAAAQAPRRTPPHLPLYHRGNNLEAQSQWPFPRTLESAKATWKLSVSWHLTT